MQNANNNDVDIPEAIVDELSDAVIRVMKKANRRMQSLGLDRDSAILITTSHVLGCCAGAICVAKHRKAPSDDQSIAVIRGIEKVIFDHTEPK